MAELLHGLQGIGLPTLVPRPPVSERGGMVQAITAGGAGNDQRHPDMHAHARVPPLWNAERGRKSPVTAPPPIDPPTGPPPALRGKCARCAGTGATQ